MSIAIVPLAVILLALLLVRIVLARRRPRVLHMAHREGTRIVVREDRRWRELTFEGDGFCLTHTRVFRGARRRSGWPYVDGFHLAALLAQERTRTLFIGAGGGIGPMQFWRQYPHMAIDVVDIEPRVFEIASRYFDFAPSDRLRAHVKDGAAFVSEPGAAYDVIVIDASNDGTLIPELSGEEFFGHVHERLRLGGILCVNVIGATCGAQSSSLRTVITAISRVFGDGTCVLFAIRGLDENALSARRDARRNHLAIAVRGGWKISVADLQERARNADIPDAPLLSAAASWPVTIDNDEPRDPVLPL